MELKNSKTERKCLLKMASLTKNHCGQKLKISRAFHTDEHVVLHQRINLWAVTSLAHFADFTYINSSDDKWLVGNFTPLPLGEW